MPCYDPFSDSGSLPSKILDICNLINSRGSAEGLKHISISDMPNATEENYQRLVDKLCSWCKVNDISKECLELQIWWRDHQLSDKKLNAKNQRD